ncbi:hypothetical protein PFLUV_G00189450 [Perca fluviatilis]|uniref:Uncharacterized protein n=1 Tax=Perca fluviatilis TaxID=8168 RepID=A0A6A5EQR9_PERFL|nr:hypothetical protein PFLUV_G00189450 [Perca fluviatilis]
MWTVMDSLGQKSVSSGSVLCAGGLRRHRSRWLSWKPVSSLWLHGEEGGAPSIITTGHLCFIVRAAADAETIADGAISPHPPKKVACPGHGFMQIKTPRMM